MQISKIKNTFIRIIAVVFIFLMPFCAFAHHSSSEFSNSRFELEGTLHQVIWRNPHPIFTFQLASTGELWNIQLPGTIESLRANNIIENSFELGQSINITGLISMQRENYLLGTHILFSNGSELVLKGGLQPLWTHETETITPVSATNNVIISEESIRSPFNYNWLLSFSIIVGLLTIYGTITFGKNKFQSAL
jgi:hypothetical protein